VCLLCPDQDDHAAGCPLLYPPRRICFSFSAR
jgi:hypothetical protein